MWYNKIHSVANTQATKEEIMTSTGIRWTTHDRYRNVIYITHERWEHITDSINHPDMTDYEEHLKETIRHGTRTQDSLNPQSIVM